MGRIIATHLTQTSQDSPSDNISSITTPSFTQKANKLILVAVSQHRSGGSGFPNVPTISGFTQIATATLSSSGESRITLFRKLSNTETTGTITIDAGGAGCRDIYCIVTEMSNVDITGTNGANAVVQSASNGANNVSSLTVTLGAFSKIHNATYGAVYLNDFSPAISPGSGFTELSELSSSHILETEFRGDNDTSVDWSVSSPKSLLGIAVELKAVFDGASIISIL